MTRPAKTKSSDRLTVVTVFGVGLAATLWIATGLRAGAAKAPTAVTETDICAVSAHPARFKNALVRFRARIWIGVEGGDLSDPSSKCIVGLSTPRAVEDDPDIKQATIEAMDALKKVTGTVTGELIVRRARHRLIPVIEAIKITDLKVTPVKLLPGR